MPSERPPTPDVEVQLNVLAELQLAFRAAIRLCDDAALRLREARDRSERERIGSEIEGFIRRLCLGALALGAPSTGQRADSTVTKGTP